jgi:uncharacterized protein
MIHPATELRFRSPEIGYGVYALEPIPAGTIVWTLCQLDIILAPPRVAVLPPAYHAVLERYAYTDGGGRLVLCWDAGRYENHSCDPTTLGLALDFDIAARDIAAGEEITCDYACLNLTTPMSCRCGAPGCRGTVGAGDLKRIWPGLDRRRAAALAHASAVPQPLLQFAREPERFLAWAGGRAPLPSHEQDRAARGGDSAAVRSSRVTPPRRTRSRGGDR